jgi:hypothetical protein
LVATVTTGMSEYQGGDSSVMTLNSSVESRMGMTLGNVDFGKDSVLDTYHQEHLEDYWLHNPLPANKGLIAVRIGPNVVKVMVNGNQLGGNKIVKEAGEDALLANNQP